MLRSCLQSGLFRSQSLTLSLSFLSFHNTSFYSSIRSLQTTTTTSDRVPLRKQLKEESRSFKADKKKKKLDEELSRQKWELTVGIEIHAQLDTETKLFSKAATSISDLPNCNVALFDLAFPGSQPVCLILPSDDSSVFVV